MLKTRYVDKACITFLQGKPNTVYRREHKRKTSKQKDKIKALNILQRTKQNKQTKERREIAKNRRCFKDVGTLSKNELDCTTERRQKKEAFFTLD